MDPEIIEVNCPTCQKIVVWGEQSPYRPFVPSVASLLISANGPMKRNASQVRVT